MSAAKPKILYALEARDVETDRPAIVHEVPIDLAPQAFAIAEIPMDYGEFALSPIVATQIARLIRKPILGRGRKYLLIQKAA